MFERNPEDLKDQVEKNEKFCPIRASEEDVVWVQDPKTYLTIMPYYDAGRIMVRVYGVDHAKLYLIEGETPQQIYYKVLKMGLITRMEHAAYLGKELQKAYTALEHRIYYNQDDPLDFSRKIVPKVEERKAFDAALAAGHLPRSDEEKLLCLNFLVAEHFLLSKVYADADVRAVLEPLFPDDFPTVRRELVNFGYLSSDAHRDRFVLRRMRVPASDIARVRDAQSERCISGLE